VLLELAIRVEVADDLIEQLIATPNANIKLYKAKLSDTKRRKLSISWKEIASSAYELKI